MPKPFHTYDLSQHMYNEHFLKDVFTTRETILPIQNLGEMAYIMQKYKESFALLDIALKLYRFLDQENLMKFKVLSLLGSLLDSQGEFQNMQKIHQTIFKALEDVECYEKVFALRNYGYLLAKNNDTRLEGKDYIE